MPGGFQLAGAVQLVVQRQRSAEAPPHYDPSRHLRLAGALLRRSHGELRRRLPAVAGACAGETLNPPAPLAKGNHVGCEDTQETPQTNSNPCY